MKIEVAIDDNITVGEAIELNRIAKETCEWEITSEVSEEE